MKSMNPESPTRSNIIAVGDLQKQSQSVKQRRLRPNAATQDAVQFKLTDPDQEWMEDSAVKSCTLCQVSFTLTRRRHHCRNCGKIVCGKCSQTKLVFQGELKRACDECYTKEFVQESVPTGFQQSRSARKPPAPSRDAAAAAASSSSSSSSSDVVDNNKPRGYDTVLRAKALADSSAPGNSSARQPVPGSAAPPPSRMSKDGSGLPPWVEAIVVVHQRVTFRASSSQKQEQNGPYPTADVDAPYILACVPGDHLNDAELRDITDYAVPATSRKELNFMFRVRNKVFDDKVGLVENVSTQSLKDFELGSDFVNCYVAFRQKKVMATNSYDRVSIVLVSHWPYSSLAFQVLAKLGEAMMFTVNAINTDDKSDGGADPELDLEVVATQLVGASFAEMEEWAPPPMGGHAKRHPLPINLNCLGDSLQYSMSGKIKNLPPSSLALQLPNAFDGVNVVSYFGRLGLLANLWTLWELVLTGQYIVVVGRHARECAEFAVALSTLVEPYVYTGDLRPYICRQESDADLFHKMAKNRSQKNANANDSNAGGKLHSRGAIVGIADIDMLDSFEGFDACVLLTGYSGVTEDNFSKVIFESRAPVFVMDDMNDKYRHRVQAWKARGSGAPVTILCRLEPSAVVDAQLLGRIRKMNMHDAVVLGNSLIRHHLEHLNKEYMKPLLAVRDIELGSAATRLHMAKMHRLRAKSTLKRDDGAIADTILFILDLPHWIPYNIPTIIMWAMLVLLVGLYWVADMPVIPLVVFVYFVQVPERVPDGLVVLLELLLPSVVLYPRGKDGQPVPTAQPRKSIKGFDGDELLPMSSMPEGQPNTAPALNPPSGQKVDDAQNPPHGVGEPADFSGIWKRVSMDNYDAFLAAQGTNYISRRVVLGVNMMYTMTMDESPSPCKWRLEEVGGPIATDHTYTIGAAEAEETTYVSAKFMDKVWWDGSVLRQSKHNVKRDYDLEVSRWLCEGGKVMLMKCVYKHPSGGADVVATVRAERQGPSPRPRPKAATDGAADETTPVPADTATGTGTGSSTGTVVNMSGTWQRTKCVNMEAFTGVQGAGYLQRKLAASISLVHTITMDPMGTQAVQVHEKGGPLDINVTIDFGNTKGVASMIQGKAFHQRAYWRDDGALVIYREADAKDYHLEMVRHLQSDGVLVLAATHIPIGNDGKETGTRTTATSWFTLKGPSPNPIPLKSGEGGVSTDHQQQEEDGQADKSYSPIDFCGVWHRKTTKNFEKFVAAQGAGYIVQKLAASMALKHTLEVSADGKSLVLEEKGGQLDRRKEYVVGGPPTEGKVLDKTFEERVEWQGDALVLTRKHVKGDFELVLTRFRDDDENEDGAPIIRLVSVHRNLNTGIETESVSVFKKK